MNGPWLLDLCCGAGAATKGFIQAGFRVVGVDLHPQPRYYGADFIQGDALALAPDLLASGRFAAVAAGPPCQRFSGMSNCRPGLAETYPDLIGPLRPILAASGLPYVIENVPGAPLLDPVLLCGTMFGRALYRHRLFESNVPLTVPTHPAHVLPASRAGHWVAGTIMSVSGHVAPVAHARSIMDIDWMTRDELTEAIPPYYAEYIGRQLLSAVTS